MLHALMLLAHQRYPTRLHTRAGLVVLSCLLVLTCASCDEGVSFDPNAGKPVEIAAAVDTTGWANAAPGTELDVAVQLRDAMEQNVADWPVVWRPRGGTTVASDTSRTDADGIAQATWTLGADPSGYVLDAQVIGVDPSVTAADTLLTLRFSATVQ